MLVGAAHNWQLLSHKLLASFIGMGPGTLAHPLGTVMRYCERNQLPPLTVLVVNSGTGRPGEGLVTVDQSRRDIDRERVFAYPWYKRLPPAVEDLLDQ